MDTSVIFNKVSKKYKLYKKTSDKLLDLVMPKGYGKDFFALKDVSFEAEKGDIIGVIGVNGAGKSTISNLISGVIPPTHGSIKVFGDATLISIATGLNNQLTGRENIELKCLMLGFSKEDIKLLEPSIIEFADIGVFIDQPVKRYSSGMKSRLGFAISVNVDPDILVIDEALSVGDKTFTKKCLVRMNEFKERGKTIFFISHSTGQIKEFCQKALWLEGGEIKAYGPIDDVLPQYEQFITKFNKMTKAEQQQYKQELLEKRSKLAEPEQVEKTPPPPPAEPKTATISDNSVLIEPTEELQPGNKDEAVAETGISPSTNSFLKKPSRKTLIATATVLVLSLGSVGTYFAWDHFASADKSTTSQAKNIAVTQLVKPLSEGFIKKAPAEDLIWWKFYGMDLNPLLSGFGDGAENSAEMNAKPQIDENLFIAAVGNFASLEQLNAALSYLGKTKAEIQAGSTLDPSLFEIAYNKDDIVISVSININPSTSEQIVQYVGQPVLTLENHAFLYHGQRYDFIIHTTAGSFFNKMTIRPVRNQNTVEQQQLEPEPSLQQEEQLEQPPTEPQLEQATQQQQLQPKKTTKQKPAVKTNKPKQKQPTQPPIQQQPEPPKEPVVVTEPPKEPIVVPDSPTEPIVEPDPPQQSEPSREEPPGDDSSAS